MDVRQVLLDARVAEAAEAWLSDPQDIGVYARLVTAIEERRRYLARTADGVLSTRPANGPGQTVSLVESRESRESQEGSAHNDDGRRPDAHPGGGADGQFPDERDADVAADVPGDRAAEPAWPAVRSVGADLVGDPVAVLRRLRGG